MSITNEIFNLVSNLKDEKRFVEGLQRNMESQYVRVGLGLVDHNHGVNPNDDAREFGCVFKDFIKRQDANLKNEITIKLHAIQTEINKHIKQEDK